MAEISHAERYAGAPPRPASTGDTDDARRAFWIDNAGTGAPFSLSVRFKDGRVAEGFSLALYTRHQWLDSGGKWERLLLLFSIGGIYLEGRFLQKGLDALEEGKLKRIREQTETEIKLFERYNLDVRERDKKEPIVARVVISPKVEQLIETDVNLAEIAKVVKEKS